MELVTPGANGHPLPSAAPAAISSQAVVQHLTDLLEVTLGASPADLESHDSLFSLSRKKDTLQRCTRFASEPQVALYVQKDITEPESNGNTVGDGDGSSPSGKHQHCTVSCDVAKTRSREAILVQIYLVFRHILLFFNSGFGSSTQTPPAH